MHIDNDIPAPPNKKAPRYPFRQMKAGDSAFFPHQGSILRCKPYMTAQTIAKRDKSFAFVGRSVVEDGVPGVRIWRV